MIAVNPTDSASVLAAFGALGVLLVVFAESGLPAVGFFLPGDTLLFPAGVLCASSGRRTLGWSCGRCRRARPWAPWRAHRWGS